MFFIQLEEFRTLGLLVGTSILQGGPGFPLFNPGVYTYISKRRYLGVIDGRVPDPAVQHLLDLVRAHVSNGNRESIKLRLIMV